MRNEMKLILAVTVIVIIAIVAVSGYMIYQDNIEKQQEQINQLNASLNQAQEQLDAQNDTVEATSTSTSSSNNKVSSSSNKVTYEEAGVNKNIGYTKTCKYPGCGARYNSALSRCPSCGHRNIYV
ncbi:hypothetical protein [Methanosphaera sp. WGK6]|uniref:hypothetical protein n=1 Tax=Methanosphaera sp. WGK6 TaxID=1561964 RepID=UPI00084C40D3|nr:hypothetical protein [Methanosphaera sp. WGK6]OED29830.1 hypothetical protein NL43_05945 [Methanosphaera sp. WGK6]